jgi:hypothetical protein
MKKTTAGKTLSKKSIAKTALKSRAKSKSKIQVKAKAQSEKATLKRKVARKSRPFSAEDLQLQQMAIREERRGVIPQSAERDNRAAINEGTRPTKKTLQRKSMVKKKPIYPLAHSE